jgi:hypothetical protein
LVSQQQLITPAAASALACAAAELTADAISAMPCTVSADYANISVFAAPPTNIPVFSDGMRNVLLMNFTVPSTFDTVNFWGVRRVTLSVSRRRERAARWLLAGAKV